MKPCDACSWLASFNGEYGPRNSKSEPDVVNAGGKRSGGDGDGGRTGFVSTCFKNLVAPRFRADALRPLTLMPASNGFAAPLLDAGSPQKIGFRGPRPPRCASQRSQTSSGSDKDGLSGWRSSIFLRSAVVLFLTSGDPLGLRARFRRLTALSAAAYGRTTDCNRIGGRATDTNRTLLLCRASRASASAFLLSWRFCLAPAPVFFLDEGTA